MTRTWMEPVAVSRALADPIRWGFFTRMARQGRLSRRALSEFFDLSAPTLTYHLKVLADAGVISTDGRGRNTSYTLNRAALTEYYDRLMSLAHTDAGYDPPAPMSGLTW